LDIDPAQQRQSKEKIMLSSFRRDFQQNTFDE